MERGQRAHRRGKTPEGRVRTISAFSNEVIRKFDPNNKQNYVAERELLVEEVASHIKTRRKKLREAQENKLADRNRLDKRFLRISSRRQHARHSRPTPSPQGANIPSPVRPLWAFESYFPGIRCSIVERASCFGKEQDEAGVWNLVSSNTCADRKSIPRGSRRTSSLYQNQREKGRSGREGGTSILESSSRLWFDRPIRPPRKPQSKIRHSQTRQWFGVPSLGRGTIVWEWPRHTLCPTG